MTAQPIPATGVAPAPAQPATPATPTAEEARWAAHVAARRPALRRHARAALLRGVWGAVSVASGLVIAVYLLTRLDVADVRAFAGAGVLAILCAFVAVACWSATHARPAPPVRALEVPELPEPSACPICGHVPTVKQIDWNSGLRVWRVGCEPWHGGAPDGLSAQCVVSMTEPDARQKWEEYVGELRARGAQPAAGGMVRPAQAG